MPKRRLSEKAFNRAVGETRMGENTRQMAYECLVNARTHDEVAAMFSVTRQNVDQAVLRVWRKADGAVQPGGPEGELVRETAWMRPEIHHWYQDTANHMGIPVRIYYERALEAFQTFADPMKPLMVKDGTMDPYRIVVDERHRQLLEALSASFCVPKSRLLMCAVRHYWRSHSGVLA